MEYCAVQRQTCRRAIGRDGSALQDTSPGVKSLSTLECLRLRGGVRSTKNACTKMLEMLESVRVKDLY